MVWTSTTVLPTLEHRKETPHPSHFVHVLTTLVMFRSLSTFLLRSWHRKKTKRMNHEFITKYIQLSYLFTYLLVYSLIPFNYFVLVHDESSVNNIAVLFFGPVTGRRENLVSTQTVWDKDVGSGPGSLPRGTSHSFLFWDRRSPKWVLEEDRHFWLGSGYCPRTEFSGDLLLSWSQREGLIRVQPFSLTLTVCRDQFVYKEDSRLLLVWTVNVTLCSSVL